MWTQRVQPAFSVLVMLCYAMDGVAGASSAADDTDDEIMTERSRLLACAADRDSVIPDYLTVPRFHHVIWDFGSAIPNGIILNWQKIFRKLSHNIRPNTMDVNRNM